MSKAQVELDYQKLLWKRFDKILKDREKESLLLRFFSNIMGRVEHYPMPLMPLDDDFRRKPLIEADYKRKGK